mgnify:FL=1
MWLGLGFAYSLLFACGLVIDLILLVCLSICDYCFFFLSILSSFSRISALSSKNSSFESSKRSYGIAGERLSFLLFVF